VAASYAFPLPSYVKARGQPPQRTAQCELEVEELWCRGRANLFFYYLERDDLHALPGYLKVEAWPGPGPARVRIQYDPALTDEEAIQRAITEPYYDVMADLWRMSPFQIKGYDPLDWELEDDSSEASRPLEERPLEESSHRDAAFATEAIEEQ
jgi:hypothetical protein